MPNDPLPIDDDSPFLRAIAARAARKLRAQRDPSQGVWFGLGMSGLIGWSVAVPTLLGAMLGIWWDRRHPSRYSWTLMLMLIGLITGCANAWRWVGQQDRAMHEDAERKP